MKQFDAIIIGSGQAGNPLAHNLADKDWKVALIEKDHLGGSCVNYGCTPTKTMIASARAAHAAKKAAEIGIYTKEVKVDLKKIVERKNDIVKQWRNGQEKQAEKRDNITVIYGTAKFTAEKTISVNGEILTADKIFINTGTSPVILPIDGIDDVPYHTNKNIMDIEEVPEHLIVIGGSYIGLEFGQMFLRFGSRVTVIEYSERILPKEDEELSNELKDILENEGIKFLFNADSKSVKMNKNGAIELTVTNMKNETNTIITGSHILLSSGRKPNTDELNLEAAGIKCTKGFIDVDEYLQTNVKGIFALGDVKGGPAFTNISYNDYQVVFNNLFNNKKRSIKNRIVPYALFTDPELGRVGMTESDAKKAGCEFKVGIIPMSSVARAIEMNETAGMMKIVVNANNDQILGASILGVNGGEVVHTLMALMYAKASWKTIKDVVYIHPTITEGFFGLLRNVE